MKTEDIKRFTRFADEVDTYSEGLELSNKKGYDYVYKFGSFLEFDQETGITTTTTVYCAFQKSAFNRDSWDFKTIEKES